jgi:hypothetical protein
MMVSNKQKLVRHSLNARSLKSWQRLRVVTAIGVAACAFTVAGGSAIASTEDCCCPPGGGGSGSSGGGTANLETTSPFINTWLVNGLYDNSTGNSGYTTAHIAETTVTPHYNQTDGGKTWKYFDDRLFSRNYDDYQDLYSYFKVKQSVSVAAKVVYAHVYIHSLTAQSGKLKIGADNEFKAWLNGTLATSSTASSPTAGSPSTWGNEASETQQNSGKDFVSATVSLNAGWNRLLLKVANQSAGRFGFYARLTNSAGDTGLPGLTYSTEGGSGSIGIASVDMLETSSGSMPVAYREWPYVGAKPDESKINATVDRDGIPLTDFLKNRKLMMQSSPFYLNAYGGTAPYSWYSVSGALPRGLRLDTDGAIRGTVAASAALGNYSLTVRVRDSVGGVANKTLGMTVRERPNKWYEEARLSALIHGPESTPPTQVSALAQMMKKQGYKVGMPISYNNGDMLFRWPSTYASPGKKTTDDWVSAYKTALEAEGLKFGMYMGNLNVAGDPNITVNQQILMVEEAINAYHPKVFWFDWLGVDATSVDSLYSMIKSYDPDTVIILNGYLRGSSGDWDIIDFEGWAAWGTRSWQTWPTQVPWPKKHAPESWRLLTQSDFSMSPGITTDWQEMLRIQITLIGEGNIANIDHTPYLGTGTLTNLGDSPLMQMHTNMANWASPTGKPALYPSYTEVNPGPLRSANWGYDTINRERDTIYLHMMSNPNGKTGKPADSSITVGPIEGTVASVTWMNQNQALTFTQRGTATDRTITVDLTGVTTDPIDTIIKIKLNGPLALPSQGPKVTPIPVGNLAFMKPAQLLGFNGTNTLIASAGQLAKYGVDGNTGTSAAGANEYAWTYHVDLGQTYPINKVILRFAAEGYATEYKVYLSDDGVNWTQVVHQTSAPAGAAPRTHTFTSTNGRYVRVQSILPNGPNQTGGQMSIAELEVYENVPAQIPVGNLATGKTAQLLSRNGLTTLGPSAGQVAANGVDGNPATTAAGAGDYAWMYHVDLGRVYPLNKVAVTFHTAGWATEYYIYISDDGTNWTTITHQTGVTSSASPHIHNFDARNARYVRVDAVTPNGPSQTGGQMSISELEVYEQ